MVKEICKDYGEGIKNVGKINIHIEIPGIYEALIEIKDPDVISSYLIDEKYGNGIIDIALKGAMNDMLAPLGARPSIVALNNECIKIKCEQIDSAKPNKLDS